MACNLAILGVTARWLGPEGRGDIAAITAWVGLFSTVAYLSLGQVALHNMTGVAGKNIGNLIFALLLITIVMSLLGWLTAVSFHMSGIYGLFANLPQTALTIAFLSLPFLIWEQYGSALLMGLDRIDIYNRYQALGRTTSLIVVLVLAGNFELSIDGVMIAILVGQIIVSVGGLGYLMKYVRIRKLLFRFDLKEIRELIVGGAKLHLSTIGAFLITSANILILSKYHGPAQTGYFQLALQLLSVLMVIPMSVSMVLYGRIVKLGPDGAWLDNKRLLMQTTIGMFFLSCLAAALAPWGISLVAGEAFWPAVEPFRWMLLGLIGMTFSTIVSPQWIGRGYFWQAALLTIIIGMINLVANLWLIPPFGMMGAAYAFTGTYIFSVLGNGAMAIHCDMKSRAV